MDLRETIRTIPDYPKSGIMYRDITTLLGHPEAFSHAVDTLSGPYAGQGFDRVAGVEARGFIIGGAVAARLGLGFMPVRKKGKLPWRTISQSYELEYGIDEVEIHEDACAAGEKILLVDDLLATGGTAEAALRLIERTGATVAACAFIIDLPELGGAAKLRALGKEVRTLIEFEGD